MPFDSLPDSRALPGAIPPTKTCTQCSVDKPLSAYGKQKGGRFGLHPRCKQCRQAAERARYYANREEILAKQKASPVRKAYRRGIWRRRAYGLSHQEFAAIVEVQAGRCAICRDLVGDQLVVDHDHVSSEIRALLCRPCNVGLGHFRDDPALLRAAAKYLASMPHTPFTER